MCYSRKAEWENWQVCQCGSVAKLLASQVLRILYSLLLNVHSSQPRFRLEKVNNLGNGFVTHINSDALRLAVWVSSHDLRLLLATSSLPSCWLHGYCMALYIRPRLWLIHVAPRRRKNLFSDWERKLRVHRQYIGAGART